MADFPAETGRAVVAGTFPLGERGRVLVLGEHEGTLPRDGIVSNGTRWIAYSGPEFADGPDGRSSLAVIVEEQDAAGFGPAARLTFMPAQASTAAAIPEPQSPVPRPSSD